MTEALFRDDSYRRDCEAVVVAVGDGGIVLDRTVFYAAGGGQPGDTGVLRGADGKIATIVDCVHNRTTGDIVHVAAEDASPLSVGDHVTAEIDWERRHRLMRMHSCLHLLCAVVPGAVTGGSVGDGKGRLDFDLPDATLDKAQIERDINNLIADDRPLRANWISDEDLAAQPDLVRTMSVKPPTGTGRVRVIAVDGVDLQPCGGTHVRTTGEIGHVRVGKIEKKGKHNRRVNVHLVEPSSDARQPA
ncbi:MAG: alanyl-tRNA editing protein [Rhodospirillales bacterium]|nr:alanyl-tRNA editing protein [Rhodospirillales bacterium]